MSKNRFLTLLLGLVLFLFLLVSLAGCASAPKIKQIGKNRYQLQAVVGFSGWDPWDNAARQMCPNGYKVLERNILRGVPDLMVGTVECDEK